MKKSNFTEAQIGQHSDNTSEKIMYTTTEIFIKISSWKNPFRKEQQMEERERVH